MKILLHTKLIRYAIFALILLGVPLITLGLWQVFHLGLPTVSPLVFMLPLVILLSVAIVSILSTEPLTKLPSAREYELATMSSQLITLYKESPVPYITVDKKGEIVMYNLAAVRLFHTNTEALLGTKLEERITHEDTNELSMVLGRFASGVSVPETDVQIVTVDNQVKWVLLSVYAEKGSQQRLISLVDITHQKAVDAAKSEFVALATHQLRTPITAIRWNVELLHNALKDSLEEPQQQYLKKVERNVLRMIALINDFLSVSKLETGTFATEPTNINLEDFFKSVLDEHTEAIAKKQLTVTPSCEPVALPFTTDTRLLHVIVSNLLSNAVKYTPEGGSILLGYVQGGDRLQLFVNDTGIGVPADELEQLFTKFFRARNAQTHHAEGTGLGLYIVKQCVEQLGGTITVTSEENKGMSCIADLPYVHEEA